MIFLHELISEYSTGLKHARFLESKLRQERISQLYESRKSAQKKYDIELNAWKVGERERQENYNYRLKVWQQKKAENDAHYKQQLALWQKRKDDIERRHKARVEQWEKLHLKPLQRNALLIWVLFFFTLSVSCLSSIFTLFFLGQGNSGLYFALVSIIFLISSLTLIYFGIRQRSKIKLLRANSVPRVPIPPKPQREPISPEPKRSPAPPQPVLEEPSSLDIEHRWFEAISAMTVDMETYYPGEFGDEGEEVLFNVLSGRLPDDYFALRNILLRYTLDADLILVGPTGIWLLDSKYWSGDISYTNMQWFRDGQPLSQESAPDLLWASQEKIMLETLNIRVKQNLVSWEDIFTGGIAFTHPKCTLRIDDNIPLRAATTPEKWVEIIRQATPLPSFNLDLQLRVVDAICAYSYKPRKEKVPSFRPSPSSGIADEIYMEVETKIEQYINKYNYPS